MLEVSSVEPSPRIDRWWENSSDETTLHILFCAKTLLTSPMECPPRHHKETYAMIYTFTGLVLVNAITLSPPHPLSDDSPPTKQKSVGNFTIKPSHQQNRKTMPCYAPAITTFIVICNY